MSKTFKVRNILRSSIPLLVMWIQVISIFAQSSVDCEALNQLSPSSPEYIVAKAACELQESVWEADYLKGEQISEQTQAVISNCTDSVLIARYLLIEAELFKIRQDLHRATLNYEEAIRIFDRAELINESADAKISLAEFYRSTEQYDLAILQLRYIVKLDSGLAQFSPRVMARAWHRLAAIAYEYEKNPDRAIDYSMKSLSYSTASGLLEHQDISYNELGAAYYALKDIDSALKNLEKALSIWRKLGRPHYEANSLLAIVRIKGDLDPEEGLKLYDDLLFICTKHHIPSISYLALQGKGRLLFQLGEYDQAMS